MNRWEAVLTLRVYNTFTGRKEMFKPIREGVVNMFVCGPTVYDFVHLGHARTYIFYDILARYLASQGHRVRFTVNITDLDEKVFDKARKEGVPYQLLAERYTQRFYDDIASLGVDTITLFAKASDYVRESVSQVETLLKKGYAYAVDGNIYFDVSRFPDYGRLSHQSPLELRLRRINPEPRKRSQSDFLLWTVSHKGEPVWESPMGKGRPGWHIEDTAISVTVFGPRYDIHGGAIDLIFPHHEAEIAQAEALTEEKPFVKYWIHTGILDISGRKMSKSLGNYITIRDAVFRYGADTLRLYFASCHYRRRMEFSEDGLKEAEEKLEDLRRSVLKIERLLTKAEGGPRIGEGELMKTWMRYEKEFFEAMDDDFNTPQAIKTLLSWATEVNGTRFEQNSKELLHEVQKRFQTILRIIGLRPASRTEAVQPIHP